MSQILLLQNVKDETRHCFIVLSTNPLFRVLGFGTKKKIELHVKVIKERINLIRGLVEMFRVSF